MEACGTKVLHSQRTTPTTDQHNTTQITKHLLPMPPLISSLAEQPPSRSPPQPTLVAAAALHHHFQVIGRPVGSQLVLLLMLVQSVVPWSLVLVQKSPGSLG